MMSQGEDVEAYALIERGWSVVAIARHLGRDPKTIRGYLSGERVPLDRAGSPYALRACLGISWRNFSADPVDSMNHIGYALFNPLQKLVTLGNFSDRVWGVFHDPQQMLRRRPHGR